MVIIITVPSLLSFVMIWTILDNLLYDEVTVVAVVHFIAMVLSLNISKKLLVKK